MGSAERPGYGGLRSRMGGAAAAGERAGGVQATKKVNDFPKTGLCQRARLLLCKNRVSEPEICKGFVGLCRLTSDCRILSYHGIIFD